MKPRIGDHVTCIVPEEAYYSNYGGKPVMIFRPGMIGIVAAIAPKVRKSKGPGRDNRDHFVVVDYTTPETGRVERVGLDYCNVKIVN